MDLETAALPLRRSSDMDVRTIRRASGLSQIQLSHKAGVSRFRLSLAETGSISLEPTELAAIMKAIRPEMERVSHITSEFQSLAGAGASL
jgi:predicted transcriptional regulator